jgi:hypothetical protein
MHTSLFGRKSKKNLKHYVIIGNGKTVMGTAVYLQRKMNASPNSISCVIPKDIWMLTWDGPGTPSCSWPQALLEHGGGGERDPYMASVALEAQGAFVQLPPIFAFPLLAEQTEIDALHP